MMQVVHILRNFGHPNQAYTTALLERLDQVSKTHRHLALCDEIKSKSLHVKVHKTNKIKKRPITIYYLLQALFWLLRDPIINKETKTWSFKKRLKFIMKWLPLLKENVDVVHIHHLQVVNEALLRILYKKESRLIISLRGMELMRETLSAGAKQEFLKQMQYADAVHVISRFMYHYAIESGIPKEKLHMVYRGFDSKGVQTQNVKQNINTLIKSETIRLLAVGRLDWEKGHDTLLESIAKLKEMGWKIKLDIYGSGSLEGFLRLRTSQLNLEQEVQFMGFCNNNELKKRYKEYDRAVQPSLFEALSNGLLDMAIHQLPCVIPQVGGMPEIIQNKKNGIVYNPVEPEVLVEALIQSFQHDFPEIKYTSSMLWDTFSMEQEIQGLESLYL